MAGWWTLILAPLVAHGLWRPLVGALGDGSGAERVTWLSLTIAAVATGTLRLHPGLRWTVTFGIVLAAGALGGTADGLALGVGAVVINLLLPLMVRFGPGHLDGLARGRPVLTGALVVVGLCGALLNARNATFQGDVRRADQALTAHLAPPFTHHACSTAYFHAAHLAAERVDNLYLADHWPSLQPSTAPWTPYPPFDLDAFVYPPPFLLLPHALGTISSDFEAFRALWFGFNGLVTALGLWILVVWLNRTAPRAAGRAYLLTPILWASLPVLITLQVGNIHPAILVMALLAMVAFDRDRPALGGALLAFATLAKISPGLLGLVLVVQRRWRPVGWTAGFGILWSLGALVVFGPAPFLAFVQYELPRLASGEGLAFLTESDITVVTNAAPFGLPFKLERLGVALADPWALARTFGRVFTVILVGLTLLAARHRRPPHLQAGLWLAVLTLGALQSPLAPPYIGFTFLWLLTVWAAEVHHRRHGMWLGLAVLITVAYPMPLEPALVVSLVQQVALVGVLGWWAVRPPVGQEGEKRS